MTDQKIKPMIKGSDKQTRIHKVTFLVQEFTSKQVLEQFPTYEQAEQYLKELTIKGWFIIIKINSIH